MRQVKAMLPKWIKYINLFYVFEACWVIGQFLDVLWLPLKHLLDGAIIYFMSCGALVTVIWSDKTKINSTKIDRQEYVWKRHMIDLINYRRVFIFLHYSLLRGPLEDLLHHMWAIKFANNRINEISCLNHIVSLASNDLSVNNMFTEGRYSKRTSPTMVFLLWLDLLTGTTHGRLDKGLRAPSQGWDQFRTTLQSTVSNQGSAE